METGASRPPSPFPAPPERRQVQGAGRAALANHGVRLWPKPVVRRVTFHHLRHTTGSLFLMSGVPLEVVQKILRHTHPANGTKKAGTQGDQATGFRPLRVERETGFEPATLSLGS
ncbi:MAG: tyrosine-type recombinase/integrase [Myxococcales bacterium]